jgi:hypothetical protein
MVLHTAGKSRQSRRSGFQESARAPLESNKGIESQQAAFFMPILGEFMKLLAFVSIPVVLAGGMMAGEFLPLETGNFWIYRHSVTGESFTVRVGIPVMQSDRVYYSLQGYAGRNVLARVDEQGRLVSPEEETEAETVITAFRGPAGEWWRAEGRECLLEGQTQERRGAHEGPAGRWNEVLEVQYRGVSCADAGPTLEQFAENIGMVRRVVSAITGPQSFDLVYARVGRLAIESGDRGRFTVAAEQAPGEDFWRVTLRLDTGSYPGIRVRLPSAQEFDVALRNAAGQVIWRWSDGRFFPQAVQDKELPNNWAAMVKVPHPNSASLEQYVIEGRLATSPGETGFAAATTVSLPAGGGAVQEDVVSRGRPGAFPRSPLPMR